MEDEKVILPRENLQEILSHVDKDYFSKFDTTRGQHKPHVICVACADARISPTLLLSVNPGKILVSKPLGGFLPKTLKNDESLSGWFALASGMKKVPDIVLIAHSDCAAGKVARKYPDVKSLRKNHPEYKNVRSIQKYLTRIGADLPKLSKAVMAQANGDKQAATDLMTKILSVFSMKNIMDYKFRENQSETIGEAIATGKVSIALLYIDLEKKTLEYFDSATGHFVPVTMNTPPLPTTHYHGKDIGLFAYLPKPPATFSTLWRRKSPKQP